MKTSRELFGMFVSLSCLTATAVVLKADSNAGIPKVIQSKNDPNVGIKYKKNQGLFVTDISARLIGLKMADVEERTLPRRLELTAQIYDAAPVGKALATAWLPIPQAEVLPVGTAVTVGKDGRAIVSGVSLLTAAVNQQAEVLLEVEDSHENFIVGQFVEVAAILQGSNEAVVVPKTAVLRTSEGIFAYADNDGWKVRTPIRTGAENNGYVEVTEGLLAGDSVVVHPVMTLWMTELQLTKSGKA